MPKFVKSILLFLLWPFSQVIRYGALKLMKKMHHSDDSRPLEACSQHILSEKVMPSIYNFFQDKKFQELANFNKLSSAEHDRIFNELQVAGLIVAKNSIIEAKHYVKDGDFHFWTGVEERFYLEHQKNLEDLGISNDNSKFMIDLVKMREKEYEDFADSVWQANILMSKEIKELIEKKFHNSAGDIKRLLSTIHAIAFGAVNHIRKGKIQEKDPLVNYTVTWLLILRNKIIKFVKNL